MGQFLSPETKRSSCTLAGIIREHGSTFKASHNLATVQYKAMRAIEICRTSTLGGHRYECDNCSKVTQSYNSCRNRHCPQCQAFAKAKWLTARQKECLPVEYFHVVFTLPHDLNVIAQCNPRFIYNQLYKSAWHAIKTLGADPKRLGGEMGMMGVLYTWGQNLSQHIHLHCVIPGGALIKETGEWLSAKSGFLFPVKALSRLFRGNFISALRDAFNNKEIKLEGKLSQYLETANLQSFFNVLMKNHWVVYSKPPFDGANSVLKYLSRYTHKIAITNQRIISCENEQVCFWWRDYAHENKKKIMKLAVNEFLRRFMLHVLPARFVRIRHLGFLSNASRRKKLQCIRQSLSLEIKTPNKIKSVINDIATWFLELTGKNINQCPFCTKGELHCTGIIPKLTYWDSS